MCMHIYMCTFSVCMRGLLAYHNNRSEQSRPTVVFISNLNSINYMIMNECVAVDQQRCVMIGSLYYLVEHNVRTLHFEIVYHVRNIFKFQIFNAFSVFFLIFFGILFYFLFSLIFFLSVG